MRCADAISHADRRANQIAIPSAHNSVMTSDSFIDEPTSVLLDLVRGGAALVVLIAHGYQLGVYTGPWPFTGEIQHDAVLLFFVLSGIVIRSSVDKPGMTWRRYAASRARRILPVAIAAVLFSTAACMFCMWLTGAAPSADRYEQATPAAMILPLLFLSEHPGGIGPAYDPSYWSLCYEVAYYALFGAFYFLRGWRRIFALALLSMFAGMPALLLLPSWLFGVYLAATPAIRRIVPRQGMMLIAASLLGIATFTMIGLATRMQAVLVGWNVPLRDYGFSQHAGSDVVIGFYMALGFAGLRAVAPVLAPLLGRVAPLARWLAAISFSLYLFHWPVIRIMLALGVTGGPSLARFFLVLLVPLAVSAFASSILERKTPWRRLWRRSSGIMTTAPVAG
jgi:peptidoglycan/LPS O-acetylase OafA/YrhL